MKISKHSSYQWLLNLPSSLYTLASDHSNESSVTDSKKKVDTTNFLPLLSSLLAAKILKLNQDK